MRQALYIKVSSNEATATAMILGLAFPNRILLSIRVIRAFVAVFFARFVKLMAAFLAVLVVLIPLAAVSCSRAVAKTDELIAGFRQPPASARPWVYWFIMDGNFSREGITADLEAMQRVGIGGAILMEVDVGIPRGPVKFMSAEWRALFKHAVEEAERLGLEITLNAGPGWTGSGGPWVKPEQSMQHLVASAVQVAGPTEFNAVLPLPQLRKPYFGEKGLPEELLRVMRKFYMDVAVLAVPRTADGVIADLDEKALYLRHPRGRNRDDAATSISTVWK